MNTTLIARKHFGTDKWEVLQRYGYRETLIAIVDTKQAALDFIKINGKYYEI